MSNQHEIEVLIHCHNLPGSKFQERIGVRLGIQKGKDVIEDVPADVASVTFKVPLRVTKNSKSGQPNFLGPFAHGTPDERFIYLCWGERQDSNWEGFRRAKVYLSHLSWESVEKAIENGRTMEAVVNMTDAKGGPLCASVKEDRIEWKV
ncbi:MAG: hypothetical protein H0W76_28070 [Pyrinomonadaceae bacterium]|nr:hypothetical protein [Pyrinomonadaceae bacterium]